MVNVGLVKRLVNSSKNFVLIMIKPKADVNHESFEGCDPKLKSDLCLIIRRTKFVLEFTNLFTYPTFTIAMFVFLR